MIASTIWRSLDMHLVRLACSFTLRNVGSRIAIMIAMIPITTNNSTKVKARRRIFAVLSLPRFSRNEQAKFSITGRAGARNTKNCRRGHDPIVLNQILIFGEKETRWRWEPPFSYYVNGFGA